ncbi:unnamed protein product [Closterium sp. Naga37s-1]|nr:unnamed protein product [Closterium sp. Naga37s-1]
MSLTHSTPRGAPSLPRSFTLSRPLNANHSLSLSSTVPPHSLSLSLSFKLQSTPRGAPIPTHSLPLSQLLNATRRFSLSPLTQRHEMRPFLPFPSLTLSQQFHFALKSAGLSSVAIKHDEKDQPAFPALVLPTPLIFALPIPPRLLTPLVSPILAHLIGCHQCHVFNTCAAMLQCVKVGDCVWEPHAEPRAPVGLVQQAGQTGQEVAFELTQKSPRAPVGLVQAGQTGQAENSGQVGQAEGLGQSGVFGQSGGIGQPECIGQSEGLGQSGGSGQSEGLGQSGVFGQSGGIGQPEGIGQSEGLGQSGGFGQSEGLGQSGVFGQSGGIGQPECIGQSEGLGQSGGSGQSEGLGQSGVFGQSGGIGQPEGIGQSDGLGQSGEGRTRRRLMEESVGGGMGQGRKMLMEGKGEEERRDEWREARRLEEVEVDGREWIRGSVEEIHVGEHQSMKYAVLILICTLKRETLSGVGGRVHMGMEGEDVVVYEEQPGEVVTAMTHAPFLYNITHCSAPIHGQVISERIYQWMDLHIRMGVDHFSLTCNVPSSRCTCIRMGVDHFSLYDVGGVDPQLRALIKPLLDGGIAEITDFRDLVNYESWYHGQVMIVNECVHRFRRLSKWIMYLDFDEFMFIAGQERMPTPLSVNHFLMPYEGMPYVTHGSLWWDWERCLPSQGPDDPRWPLERMLWHGPGVYCKARDNHTKPNMCLDHYGHRKLFVDPRRVDNRTKPTICLVHYGHRKLFVDPRWVTHTSRARDNRTKPTMRLDHYGHRKL